MFFNTSFTLPGLMSPKGFLRSALAFRFFAVLAF